MLTVAVEAVTPLSAACTSVREQDAALTTWPCASVPKRAVKRSAQKSHLNRVIDTFPHLSLDFAGAVFKDKYWAKTTI
jgi:hypothetical protein